MKHIKFIIATIATLAIFSAAADAQPKGHNKWQEKMKSEMIAFITVELELSPEEAQAFWPVYNQISKEKMESQKAAGTAYKTLMKAIEDEKSTEAQISKLLDEYIVARQAVKEDDKGNVEKYKKVLPAKKVAKLYTAEEKFRRNHIRNMKGGHHDKKQGRPDKK